VSGLSMPPANPPADNIVALLERLQAAKEHLIDAQRQASMIDVARADVETLTPATAAYFGIERKVARNRVVLWTREVRELERRGRAMGLQL
jgi:hypothetical protein